MTQARFLQTEVPRGNDDSDAAIARRIADGDRTAFATLMRRHNRRLYRVARATLRHDGDAEDALQEAYIAAYRAIGSFRGEASLSTWLTRLVLNACFARRRRDARRQALVPIVSGEAEADTQALAVRDPAAGPERDHYRSEMRALIERSLDALPESFRTVFVLRSVEELTVEETARCLGIPEETVRSRHFRARSMLRNALAHEVEAAERDVFDFGAGRCDRMVAAVLAALDRRTPIPASPTTE
jgi:RNA polymerase sigma-70 factor (ECF subfamily)